MALESRNETGNWLRICVSFHVKRTRRALEMFLFLFLKRSNEFRNALSKFPPISPPNAGKYLHFRPRLHRAVFYFANNAISKWAFYEFRLSRAASEVFMILYTYKQPTPPRELRIRNANPRPADEAEETGLGASVFRFSKHETPRELRWSVSRNETPAKIVFRFCCFITDVFQLWPYLRVTN